MPFRSGAISCALFRVNGDAPDAVTGDLLDACAEHTVRPSTLGEPPEREFGWVAGRHIFDTTFDPDTVVFAERMLLAMRTDTNRVPAEVRQAYRAMAEQVRLDGDANRRLSRRERQEAREEADEQCRQELAEGRHRRSTMTPVLWDLRSRLLYAPCTSDAAVNGLRELFSSTFGGRLDPCSSGVLALEFAERKRLVRSYEELRPSPLTAPPPQVAAHDSDSARDRAVESHRPVVPWTLRGPEPKDFLGNEFLIWLWYRCDADEGLFNTSAGEIAVVIDRLLEMDCAWDATGKQSLRGDGPSRLPEAREALKLGKWPRKVGLVLAAGDEPWNLTLQGDRVIYSGVKLPKPDEPPTTPRELIESRLDGFLELDRAVQSLYEHFLAIRLGDGWRTEVDRISEWVRHPGRGRGTGRRTGTEMLAGASA